MPWRPNVLLRQNKGIFGSVCRTQIGLIASYFSLFTPLARQSLESIVDFKLIDVPFDVY